MKAFSLLLAVFGFSLLGSAARAQDAAIIAHPGVAEAKLAADDVKNILLGTKTKWDNGAVIKLIILADGPVHEKVIKDFTQRSPDQFDKYWKKQVFTGKGIMPQVAKTEAEVVDYVTKTPGAVGYVGQAAAPASVKNLTP